ncbi:pirin-like bicupin family protein [Streptomyces sp. GESEQ-35]|uniref:pirin family protein n=1 Tax=Streptomyces sp. GESEQ-35 TaxID=2812657 RepID=UPI001B334503|nr:pirin-like bicupin family protein [Streptomyces sp. GESEQ-35]
MGTTPSAPLIDVRRSDDRSETNLSWLRGRHSFWVGGQPRDPGNTHHGLLLVHNEDTIRPGTGFDTHPHRDMEIVTWVLEGALVHQDSAGNSGVIYPGLAQRMSAGTGILHSEKNDSWRLGGEPHTNPVHLIQMWIPPGESGGTPGYEQQEIDHDLLSGGLVTVASGMAEHHDAATIRIRNPHAAFHAARLLPGRPVQLPEAPYLHLFVTRGSVELEGTGTLAEGDAVRLTASGGQRISTSTPAEILVWEMHADLAI